MANIIIREMQPEDEHFVGVCSHVDQYSANTPTCQRRIGWLKKQAALGDCVKVALLDNDIVGFLHLTPIETSVVGPLGRDLAVIPCLYVIPNATKHGVGQALMAAAEEEAKSQNMKGLVTYGHYGDFWFMPAGFFQKLGFSEVDRQGQRAILWKTFEPTEPPTFLTPNCHFEPIDGKGVADLFWNSFCGSEDRDVVHEVLKEFPNVVLREHCCDEPETLRHCQIPRGFYVNGQAVEWDYCDPQLGVRKALMKKSD